MTVTPVVKPTSTAPEIKSWLKKKSDWLERAVAKEKESGEPLRLTVSELLNKELEKNVNDEEEAYTEALSARTEEERHLAIVKIIEARQAALLGTTEDVHFDPDAGEEIKTPRKKGWLELKFDEVCLHYSESPTPEAQVELMNLISQLEVNRRVRFFYDLQQLRIGANNRRDTYAREFGIKDVFIDHAGDQLERLECHSEKMVHRILVRAADAEIYEYLRDNYLGVGVMMAGCLISEISAPERFHSVSALWKYCGLAVVGHDPETGEGGHSQRKTAGEKAAWNHFLRTKLLGVMAGCMIKAQTRYIGGPDELTKARNVKVLNDYKLRLVTKNELVSEGYRVYTASGKEIFHYHTNKLVDWFDAAGKRRGEIALSQIQRRTKGHINKMATRYMVKMFLTDILNQWRMFKGFEPLVPYDQAKLRNGVPHRGLNLNKIQPRPQPQAQL